MREYKMRSQHTPAPWIYSGIKNEEKVSVTIFSGENGNLVGTITTTNANANLIAAAPDLLDALKALMVTEDMLRNPKCQVMQSARRAIAKAQGEA